MQPSCSLCYAKPCPDHFALPTFFLAHGILGRAEASSPPGTAIMGKFSGSFARGVLLATPTDASLTIWFFNSLCFYLLVCKVLILCDVNHSQRFCETEFVVCKVFVFQNIIFNMQYYILKYILNILTIKVQYSYF